MLIMVAALMEVFVRSGGVKNGYIMREQNGK